MTLYLIQLMAGLIVLTAGAEALVRGGSCLARHLGLMLLVIGLTVVAFGTSAPEMVVSVGGSLKGRGDMAVGNAVGSNLFNILGILGLASGARPLHAPGVRGMDAWVMVAFSVALLPLLWTGRKLQRWEGGSLLGGYLFYVWMPWPA